MRTKRLWLGLAVFGATLGPALVQSSAALADVTRLVVSSTIPMGEYDGRAYRYVHGTLQGTAPGGAYSVPIELAFPISADDFSGFAVVDVVGMGQIGLAPEEWPPEGGRPHPTWPYFGETHLFDSGHVMISVMWDKARLETLGTGTIAAQTDAYEIIRDASALARDPSILNVRPERTPPASAYVIATGYSGSANVVRAWFNFGLNTAEGDPAFDGAILLVARNTNCANLAAGETAPCDPARTDGAKIISVMTETDVETRGPGLRSDTADYRQIEVAGTAHIPATLLDWRNLGAPEQNPVDTAPVFRGALANLVLWVGEGTVPPPSIYLDIPTASTRMLGTAPFWDAARDADGNALGGLRLPHMAAPLGVYHGTDEREGALSSIAGTFAPFTTEEIRARYPTRDAYVATVTAAAESLVAERYILQADADAYIAAAQAAPFWN